MRTSVHLYSWHNDEVWIYLQQWQNPWGQSNKDLFTMYRGATADNECPLVIEKEWMQPLLDIRNELDQKDDRERRDFRRIGGNVQLFERNDEWSVQRRNLQR